MKLIKRIFRIFRGKKKDNHFSDALSESIKEVFVEMGYSVDEESRAGEISRFDKAASITK